MKTEKGIAFIALVFIVIILIVIAVFIAKSFKEEIDRENVEDIKSYMLLIQGVAKNVQNKHIVDEEANPLIGIPVNLENNETGYVISEELKEKLQKIENANLYILTQEDINNNGLKQINIDNTNFYIVDYNSGDVFYSVGLEGKYALTELVDEKNEENENNVELVSENSEETETGEENEGSGN